MRIYITIHSTHRMAAIYFFLPLFRPTFVLLALSRAAFSFPSFAKYANNASTEISTTPANGEISPLVATAAASSANAGKHANNAAARNAAVVASAARTRPASRVVARVVTPHPRAHRPRTGAPRIGTALTPVVIVAIIVAIIVVNRVSFCSSRGRFFPSFVCEGLVDES